MKTREYRKETFAEETKRKIGEWFEEKKEALDDFFDEHDWTHGRNTALSGLVILGLSVLVYGMSFASSVKDGTYVKKVLESGKTVFVDSATGEIVTLLNAQGSGIVFAKVIVAIAALTLIAGLVEIVIFKRREKAAE